MNLAAAHPLPSPVEKRRPDGGLIRLENVTLRYPVGPYVKGSIKTGLFSLFGHRPLESRQRDHVTALDGVSLTIGRGERVGIIGRNGAGKSTTLQTIAGIYPVAGGRITVEGRLQSLFNIGLGFEPDATGRENILYRGLAMGFSPAAIAARTEEIIAFAELGDFINLPVRTYSSGMYVRLAFAISTCLEGDILLIDEVFGAGDEAFRKKAIARLRGLVAAAEIVVMVAHDMPLLQSFCSRVLWLDKGHVRMDGDAATVIGAYLADAAAG
jgi:lipopolysaccharide transport system ATP-binding protein